MKQIYNYDDNRLRFKRKSGLIYDLLLKSNITIIDGMSASGKTLLFNELRAIKKLGSKISGYDVSNIELITETDKDSIKIKDDKILVIIDKAEKILDKDICEKITSCDYTRFLIFTRLSYDLYVSPNHFGEFIENDKIISINYPFNERSWG